MCIAKGDIPNNKYHKTILYIERTVERTIKLEQQKNTILYKYKKSYFSLLSSLFNLNAFFCFISEH